MSSTPGTRESHTDRGPDSRYSERWKFRFCCPMRTSLPNKPPRLSDACRAELYLALGRAWSAGLPPDRSLRAAGDVCEGRLSRPIAMAAGAIAKGSGFVAALRQRELLSELDGAVLHCAEELGQLGQALQRVASLYEQRHYRWQRIKGELLVPGFVFVLGLLVMPLPALVAGEIDGGDYLGRIASTLALVAAGVWLMRKLISRFTTRGWPRILTTLARGLPWVGGVSRLAEREAAATTLALMLGGGLPALEALDIYRRTAPSSLRRSNLARAHQALARGESFTDALAEAELLGAGGSYAVVSAGEAAGRLDESLERYGEGCARELDDAYDFMARWFPVAVYVLVLGLVASS